MVTFSLVAFVLRATTTTLPILTFVVYKLLGCGDYKWGKSHKQSLRMLEEDKSCTKYFNSYILQQPTYFDLVQELEHK